MSPQKFLPFVLLLPLLATGPDGFIAWKAQDLKAYEKTLAPKINDLKSASVKLGNYGNHWAETVHREGNGEVEVHQNWNDVMIIETGSVELLIGGTVVNPRNTAPGEIRGKSSTGGEKKAVGPGDIARIPFGVPHQVLVPAGKQVTYYVAKVAAAPGDPGTFTMWKSQDLKGLEKTLSAKVNQERVAGQPLAEFGNHKTVVIHREATGDVNLHQEWNDFFVIESGEGVLVTGGTLMNPRTVSPGQIRGPSITGGQSTPLAPGDILHIPANMPHWVQVPAGKQITYFELNVATK